MDHDLSPVPEQVQRYLQHLRVERRLAPRSVHLVGQALQRLTHLAQLEHTALQAVQTHQVRQWAARLHAEGLAPRSVALVLSAWRGFYRWWGQEGGLLSNPVEGVKAPKAPRPLPKALSVDQAMALVQHTPAAPARPQRGSLALQRRDAAMLELLYGCGLRVGELLGLDVQAGPQALGHVDLDDASVHVTGKGRKRRLVPMGPPAVQAVKAWLALRAELAAPDEPALFVGRQGQRLSDSQVRGRLREWSAAAGVPTGVHPHMLRHSFASHVLQSSGDLRAVQELLGHAHIATTQVYTRLDFQHLARAYDAAHPRARKATLHSVASGAPETPGGEPDGGVTPTDGR